MSRQMAERALADGGDDGLNFKNLGGKALLGALDILDTPRAAVAATLGELADYGEYGGEFRLGDIVQGTRGNISGEEALGIKPDTTEIGIGSASLRVGPAFAFDIATDPLTFLTGGGARVGTEAGKPAARQLLKQSTKDFLGEAAATAAERSGMKFTDDAARQAYVREQGQTLAEQAAQKALKTRSNQALDPLAREAIGAVPGTFVKIPGSKRLGVDKLIEKLVPGRVFNAQHGNRAFKLTKRELGLGRLGGAARSKLTESGVGNKMAELFTKHPELRKKILFGTPEEAAVAFHGLEEFGAGQLQRRLTESTFGPRMADLLARAKKAGISGEDLRYAIAEAVDVDDVPGPASGRVGVKAGFANDPDLLDEFRAFFSEIRDHSNRIDPELPWLQHRDNYTVNLPSDEAAALRGPFSSPGGPLRREGFDFRQKYGLAEDQTDEFLGEKLLPPNEAGGRSVRQQMDDILKEKELPNLFETDAYKAFPDYVRRVSKRYGEEWMAKRLRDLGVAEPGWVMKLTERGMSQGRAKAAIQKLQVRAALRAEKARRELQDAESVSIASEGNLGASQRTLDEISGDKARYEGEKADLEAAASVYTPESIADVREYEALVRDQVEVLQVERQQLLDSIDLADVEASLLNEAQTELANRINLETQAAFERVTALELAVGRYEEELADLYDRMYQLTDPPELKPGYVRLYRGEVRDAAGKPIEPRRKATDMLPGRTGQWFTDSEEMASGFAGRRIRQLRDEGYQGNLSTDVSTIDVPQELADRYQELDAEWVFPKDVWEKHRTGKSFDAELLDELERNEQQITEISNKMREAESLLAQFEDLANMDLTVVDQQLAQLDELLPQAVAQYLVDESAASKVNLLADLKAGLLHQKDAVERARGRVADLDRSDPEAWLDELDSLRDSQEMGDKIIHAIFPDLPDEINGSRLREYFQERMPQLEQLIDDTNGQVLSAYADRDSLRVQLSAIRRQQREARRKVRSLGEDATPRMREIAEAEEALLAEADAAASRALEIEDELRQVEEAMGTLDRTVTQLDAQEKLAEYFLAAQTAKHRHYEAIRAAAEQKSGNAARTQRTWDDIARRNLNKPQEEALQSALNDNFRQLGAVSMTEHEWLVDGLRSATVMMGPKALRPAFSAFDKVQNLWKAYALSSPGSVNRNLFGGVFNNWLAGDVRPEDYTKTMAWLFGNGRGLSDADKAIFTQLEDAGLLVSSGSILEVERRAAGATNLRPWSTDNKGVQFFRRGQERVESLVRGSLAFSTLRGGGDINDAIGQVVKYHFDYDDLSSFERSVLRRVVPFYTWTRKNFPLMLEQIAQNPTRFTRFYQLKNEIEQESPEEQFVPSYFAENLAVRLPLSIGGDQAYMLPDLPFTALNDVTDPSLAFSQVSPFVKTPIEYAFGKQFFKGIPLQDEYAPVPRPMTMIPGLMPLLDSAGVARRGPNGWSMKKKDMYVAEQMMPVYGRARRLFPSEPQYNERVMASWASFALGAGLRVNTPTDRRNEAYRRIYNELESAESRQELGYVDFGYTDEGSVRRPPTAFSLYDSYFGDTPP